MTDSIVAKDETDLTQIVSVEAINFGPRVYKRLTEHVATEIEKLKPYGITAIKVIAEKNSSFSVPNMSVKIVSTAYDKSFVAEKASNNCQKITDLYSRVQSGLKDQLQQHKDRVKKHDRKYNI